MQLELASPTRGVPEAIRTVERKTSRDVAALVRGTPLVVGQRSPKRARSLLKTRYALSLPRLPILRSCQAGKKNRGCNFAESDDYIIV